MNTHVRALPLRAGKVTGEPERLTANLFENQYASISADGSTLATLRSRHFRGLQLSVGPDQLVYPGGSAEEHLVGESRIAPSSDLVTGKICWETDEVRTLNPATGARSSD